mmetsp:Transcript_42571/g.76654  ORF Transcript_42571/g.76654 Transcript_42571/m.76654 type:complete len:224 (+) Transcript_42571:725-1396(+)
MMMLAPSWDNCHGPRMMLPLLAAAALPSSRCHFYFVQEISMMHHHHPLESPHCFVVVFDYEQLAVHLLGAAHSHSLAIGLRYQDYDYYSACSRCFDCCDSCETSLHPLNCSYHKSADHDPPLVSMICYCSTKQHLTATSSSLNWPLRCWIVTVRMVVAMMAMAYAPMREVILIVMTRDPINGVSFVLNNPIVDSGRHSERMAIMSVEYFQLWLLLLHYCCSSC